MAAVDGLTFEGTFNHSSSGLYKDQVLQEIEAVDHRTLVTAIRESYLNRIDDVVDEDDMVSNSDVKVPTQQSVKTYVDAVAGVGTLIPKGFTSGTTSMTAPMDPTVTTYNEHMMVLLRMTSSSTGAVTFNFDGVGAKKAYFDTNHEIGAGMLLAGHEYLFTYRGDMDSANGGWMLVGEESYGAVTIEATAYDASGNAFPTAGSGPASVVAKGDAYVISVAGTLGGVAVKADDFLVAKIDGPGSTLANWIILYGATTIATFSTGTSWKLPVAVKTTANTTLSGEQTIDGYTTSASRILVGSQTAQTENGIYVTASGAWTRAIDADTGAKLEGATVVVQRGTLGANKQYQQTTDGVTLGSSNVVWVEVIGSGSTDASASVKGVLEVAAMSEIVAGTDTGGTGALLSVLPSQLGLTRTTTGAGGTASVQTDHNGLVIFNSASPFNFTLDPLLANTKIAFINYGAGAVTFINGSGVTLVGNATVAGATGTIYPGVFVIYDTLTSPHVISGTAGGAGSLDSVSGDGVDNTDAANPVLNNSHLDLVASAIVTTTLTLDVNSQRERNFDLTTTASGNFTIAFSNNSNHVRSKLFLRITGAIVITMPSAVIMDLFEKSAGRWNDGTNNLTLTGVTASPFMLTFDEDASGNVWCHASNRGL